MLLTIILVFLSLCQTGSNILSYRHPRGWQSVLCISPNQNEVLLVVHSFANPVPKKVEIKLSDGNWQFEDVVYRGGMLLSVSSNIA